MNTIRPLIFLDIDGVICLDGTWADERSLENLLKIRNKFNAKVILSSSWRTAPNMVLLVERWLGRKLDGCTPDLGADDGNGRLRKHEIGAYIQDNKLRNAPYIILDDCTNACLEESKFVHTNYRTGLTNELRKEAIRKLREQT